MRVEGQKITDCFDCPLLAGLTDEQKRTRIRTDPLISRCLANRRAVVRKGRRASPEREMCLIEQE